MNVKSIFLAGTVAAAGFAAASAQPPVQSKNNPQGALTGRTIAVWNSHGRYYDVTEDRWKWQRCRLFGTVEDIYTRAYVVPFLVPMLENSGAYVMLPRERDSNETELVIDPDGEYAIDGYKEENGKHKWADAECKGFGMSVDVLFNGENPFAMGGARKVKTVLPKDADRSSTATWSGIIAESAELAVYVSYPKLDKAVDDVVYTVHTASGPKEFTVNQTMGSGTWMYLGTFPFAASRSPRVLVSVNNVSVHEGVIGTDAVRIGGGMGNVARYLPGQEESAQTSGLPRWAEASRYYLQWAGMPDSVYANQENDYRDDIFCRPQWVNYMMQELGVPIDMALAFHSDAFTTGNDYETVGTLGIYYTARNGKYADGRPRRVSRALCDAVVTSLVSDIRELYDPTWNRRKMRDASYIEARVPEVPTMLLEALSHQNFADVKFGLNPRFRFDASRAVYKGVLRFLADQKLAPYIVQPLPPQGLALVKQSAGRYSLSWQATPDQLEPSANPSEFIVEMRLGTDADAPFIALDTVSIPRLTVDIPAGEIRSYRVVALNRGGCSFPSEILAAGEPRDSKGSVTVVNGFTRVSAPDHFSKGDMGGFGLHDPGVPMGKDLSYTGRQYDFDRTSEWVHDDRPGFGASHADMEMIPVWGNSYDYVLTHGKAIMAAGYAFDSRSVKAFVESSDRPDCVDLILGLQRETQLGTTVNHKVFPTELQSRLETLALDGVPVMASGAYVATDSHSVASDADFLRRVLGVEWRTDHATVTGKVSEINSELNDFFADGTYTFASKPGQKPYCVASPDAIYHASGEGTTIMRYDENRAPAAVAFAPSSHRSVTLGFPFEAIQSAEERSQLMMNILKFLNNK